MPCDKGELGDPTDFHLFFLFSRDVTVTMLVSPTNPPGIELYYYTNVFFCLGGKTKITDHASENTITKNKKARILFRVY